MSKLVEWMCWAVPQTAGAHCGHQNAKIDRSTERERNLFGYGLCCDKCGRPKTASDHRLATKLKAESITKEA